MKATGYGLSCAGSTAFIVLFVGAAALAALLSGCAAAPPDGQPPPPPPGPETVAGWRMVDLSHAYADDMPRADSRADSTVLTRPRFGVLPESIRVDCGYRRPEEPPGKPCADSSGSRSMCHNVRHRV